MTKPFLFYQAERQSFSLDSRYGVTYEDFSSVEMTTLGQAFVRPNEVKALSG
ncbi:hypothetical protein ACHRVW_04245 [Flavobacterium collinsii]|uniref:hypothetical protein n=1 Tax=Flavobacterium collinsii TaxID=1114861 RepID=UPI0021DF6008|nr:hypothetical protein [Flavobacterium collinsii]